MASNGSKPYQAQVIVRHGFSTPDTLISTDPQEVLDFAARHRQVVYKSCSGIRSIVTAFDPVADAGRLPRLRWPERWSCRSPGSTSSWPPISGWSASR